MAISIVETKGITSNQLKVKNRIKCMKREPSEMVQQVKASVDKSGDLNLIPEIHMVKRENQSLKTVFWSLCMSESVRVRARVRMRTHAHIKQM